MATKRKKIAKSSKFFFSETEGVEIWYFVCGISQVEHKNKERKFYNSSSLKLDGLELWYFVCSISLWTSTKFIHMMPQGSGLVRPGGHKLEHRNKEYKFQIFSSLKVEGLQLWYLVCSISYWTSTKFVNKMPLGSKPAPPLGSQVEHRNKEQKFYNSSSLKPDGLELWYFVCSISLWTSTKFIHMIPQGSGLVQPWGS